MEEELVRSTMLSITRSRRNVLLACGALAAGGYVTYRVYHFRKRLRVYLFFQSFSSLLEVLSQGSISFAIILSDLHGFLVSDKDEVPQSIKQLLKLASSHEAQEGIAALSAAVSRGVLSTFVSGKSVSLSLEHEEQTRKLQPLRSTSLSPRGAGHPEETKNVIKWSGEDIRVLQEGISPTSTSLDDRALSPDEDENTKEFSKNCDVVLEGNGWTNAGSILNHAKTQVSSSIVRGTKEVLQEGSGVGSDVSGNGERILSGKRKGKEDLVDRLVDKLFSDSGKGFASAVVASASRSFVASVIEYINTSNALSREDESGSGGGLVKSLVAFASSVEGRSAMTECIQNFVGTAVSVYLDRTKDINTFDELVAGLVKPEHRGPITDLLTTVCEVSTSSFVHSCHEAIKSDPSSSKYNAVRRSTVFCPDFDDTFHDNDDVDVFYDMGEEPLSPCQSPVKWKGKTVAEKNEAKPINYIDQISKVIAVPSNRKLILDIAGTMTASGVRSMIDVSLGKVSAAFGRKGKAQAVKQDFETSKRSGVGEKLQAVGDATKAAMDKSTILMTMCYAVCLHSVLGGVRMIQPF
ncbi:protein PHLOEM PROTEIN 2-LIKE A10 [Physcomitrium patens]|uniref:Protein PHLOEM PROTEIN 2-LIKE A10 n=1 Tax=Physcomitrium patens TaxID=3218 RepID=A0A2K1JGX2_PHYPA|nr:protein PHLOEM PROTEIN 2-LIKE A10-like [Physcomitrium patens]PNR40813.1 hypothetical protein PHYPA_018216 [Physcomitrium patens]|eukprot:XP_024395289.1 protein PHLOEM PROTEIN 2-LIKE A10-like [Physcomitrella patens]